MVVGSQEEYDALLLAKEAEEVSTVEENVVTE